MGVTYNYGAGPTYTKIASQTLGSSQNSIEFTNIPSNYTDLVIVFTGTSTTTGSATNGFRCRINGDTGSNYSQTTLKGNGTTATSDRINNNTFFEGEIGQTSNTSPSINILQIMNYANTTTFKTVLIRTAIANDTVQAHAVLYRSTSAITSVTLSRDFGVNQIKSGSTATLYGIAAALTPKATGGTITFTGSHFVHTFKSSGIFNPSQNLTADYLVVAGGGGGGMYGGGGGAGGMRCTVGATGGGGSLESALSLNAGTVYTVTIGAGGSGGFDGTLANRRGVNGNNSVFATITSTGGGGAGGLNQTGLSGGSGGGGGVTEGGNASPAGGSNSPSGEGRAGGSGVSGSVGSRSSGGGGGGGAVGANGSSGTSGAGGAGVATSISGSSVTYAGGGGGGNDSRGGSAAAGGSGGGGAGTTSSSGQRGTAGTASTGGGGGGSGFSIANGYPPGASGGSGIVIVRYSA